MGMSNLQGSEGTVTVAVSRRVRHGRETEFAEWVRGITDEASRFPGHLGAGYIRPAQPGGEHVIVYRFDTPEHFNTWQSSKDRARWMQRSRDLISGEPRIETATGLEYWFRDVCPQAPSGPPVWKQALVIWIGLYPTVLLFGYAALWLIGHWPLPLRSLITTGLTVALMTWLIMPVLTRLLRRWLQPPSQQDNN